MKLYVASSWRNPYQPAAVEVLRAAGHEVYDFRHPPGGDHLGFSWSDVDPDWTSWSTSGYLAGLSHPIAQAGFESDFGAMQWADAGVLILPAGRSAHLEAGYFVGAGKLLVIVLDEVEFLTSPGHPTSELMYLMADAVVTNMAEAIDALAATRRARDMGSEIGRLLAERDRLVAAGVDPAELEVPKQP